ncbi:MAG: hypothetical protein AB2758_20845 [Candidatus Thiodiazotropha endolucinida]
MLSNLFDEYSLNARVRPSLLALLPLIIATYISLPALYNIVATLLSIIVACGFITALAHYSRHRGRKTEERLFSLWGGKPTTIILRHLDDTLDGHTKTRYQKYLTEQISGWSAPTIEDEQRSPDTADKLYDSAVRWLLEKTRDTKQYRLLFIENISYGFRRNARGIKWFGVMCSVIAVLLIIVNIYPNPDYLDSKKYSLEYSSLIFSIVMFMWWLVVVSDTWVKDAAESYALRLLAVCENQK